MPFKLAASHLKLDYGGSAPIGVPSAHYALTRASRNGREYYVGTPDRKAPAAVLSRPKASNASGTKRLGSWTSAPRKGLNLYFFSRTRCSHRER